MLPYCTDNTVVVFHDSWIIGVPEAVKEAKRRGMRCLWIPTSCEMILATTGESVFAELETVFPEGNEERRRRSYLYGYWLHLREVLSFRFGEMRGS